MDVSRERRYLREGIGTSEISAVVHPEEVKGYLNSKLAEVEKLLQLPPELKLMPYILVCGSENQQQTFPMGIERQFAYGNKRGEGDSGNLWQIACEETLEHFALTNCGVIVRDEIVGYTLQGNVNPWGIVREKNVIEVDIVEEPYGVFPSDVTEKPYLSDSKKAALNTEAREWAFERRGLEPQIIEIIKINPQIMTLSLTDEDIAKFFLNTARK